MLKFRMFCWVAIICGALSLASGEQTKTTSQRQTPAPVLEINSEMQVERNKVPVRQLYEDMFTRGRYELIEQVFDKRCPVHFGARNVGLGQAVAEGKGWRSAAPDLVMRINEITAKGDRVTAVWTATGTHTGHGHGLKPTGRRISLHGKSEFRVVNGKIVEAWNEEYRPELFRQLGVSKAAAFMFETADGLWSAMSQILPDRLYALLQ
jgi:predicted ester cyclase